MKEEILTAKEWLKTVVLTKGCADPDTMEKYANSKNKALEDRIREFREDILKGKWIKYLQICNEERLQEYDKHFNIK